MAIGYYSGFPNSAGGFVSTGKKMSNLEGAKLAFAGGRRLRQSVKSMTNLARAKRAIFQKSQSQDPFMNPWQGKAWTQAAQYAGTYVEGAGEGVRTRNKWAVDPLLAIMNDPRINPIQPQWENPF